MIVIWFVGGKKQRKVGGIAKKSGSIYFMLCDAHTPFLINTFEEVKG